MKRIDRIFAVAYFAFWTSRLLAANAYAYIDPTTTAMITQIVAGVFISLGFAFGIFRRRIIMFFKNLYVKMLQKKLRKGTGKNGK
ncbi:MAG: hypothetical protein LBE65_04435 [Synergistaceae bacterium]|nr:hypothetical protein [Synergistaceae bacterium]